LTLLSSQIHQLFNISADEATERAEEQLLSLILNEKETLKEYFFERRDFSANRSKKLLERRTDEEKARLKAEENARIRERYRKRREAMGKSYSEGKQRKSLDQIKKDLHDPTKSRRPRNPRAAHIGGEKLWVFNYYMGEGGMDRNYNFELVCDLRYGGIRRKDRISQDQR
jgi:hypothetical protein